jgi:predicted dithiol-disulfide oxidoreductase (DUF899 family)
MQTGSKATREQWLVARRALLEREKALTRARDDVTKLRAQLPWVKVTESYQFDAPEGPVSLADLFGDKDQLIVQHFMYGADWEEGCPSCSFWSDNFQGALIHLGARDAAFVAVSQAPLSSLLDYQQRMGWKHRWVSAQNASFSNDYHVFYTPDQLATGETGYNFQPGHHYGEHAPGISVFARGDDGQIYHTYSVYARGLDTLNGTYQLLDLLPAGRNEQALDYPMAWLRRADQYD